MSIGPFYAACQLRSWGKEFPNDLRTIQGELAMNYIQHVIEFSPKGREYEKTWCSPS